MKIFNIENGIEKVYVQMNDIGLLNSAFEEIPVSIFYKVFRDIVIIDDRNRMDFIEFSEQQEIDFFRNIDWIVDYKEIRNLSKEEIIKRGQEVADEINKLAQVYNNMSFEEKNPNLLVRSSSLQYKMKYMVEILLIKQGKKTMPFPLVPDSDGLVFSNDDGLYEIKTSLDSNKLLLYRKDGLCLSDLDIIPQGLINEAVISVARERSKNDEFFGDFDISRKFSDDRKYLIIEFKVKKYKQETGIKKFIKTLFGNKK